MTLWEAYVACRDDELMTREGRRDLHIPRQDTFIATCNAASVICGGDILADDWIIVAAQGERHDVLW